MKALILKELRENARLATLGCLIFSVLLSTAYRDVTRLEDLAYGAGGAGAHPLMAEQFLMATTFFCAIFGALLGWVQIFNERPRDLWAFLVHRPLRRTQVFYGKTIAGLGLYVLAAGVPLAGVIALTLVPGRVAAPFDWAMVLPALADFLAGLACYFAGLLTGLRQARWYASRALTLGLGVVVCGAVAGLPEFWQAAAVILLGGAILATAAWASFQTDGYYTGQPWAGRIALTVALLPGCLLVLIMGGGLLSTLLPDLGGSGSFSQVYYQMAKDGAVYRVSNRNGKGVEIVDLKNLPLRDSKTGQPTEWAQFQQQIGSAFPVHVDFGDRPYFVPSYRHGPRFFRLLRATGGTIWYYSVREGRVLACDAATKRQVGSLGPGGFSSVSPAPTDRFGRLPGRRFDYPGASRTFATPTAVFLADLQARAVRTLFTTSADDPIGGVLDISPQGIDWEYTLVVTKRFVHLLTREGKGLWKLPYAPGQPEYTEVEVTCLSEPNPFAVWFKPDPALMEKTGRNLPKQVVWIASDGSVSKRMELPPTPGFQRVSDGSERMLGALIPPVWALFSKSVLVLSNRLGTLPLASILCILCIAVSVWLTGRYALPQRARLGWAAFHLAFGVPGLLTFLCVQEWPAREACPQCRARRVVTRAKCEHCGAGFSPPDRNGTEIFEPLPGQG